MLWYLRFILAVCILALPVVAVAQGDVCLEGDPAVAAGDQARAEQLRIQASERLARELEQRSWEVKIFSVKNEIPTNNLRALCIFRIEVVPQPALRMVQVRAPKEFIAAIEDVLKRLDVPVPTAKNIELTAYVLAARTPYPPNKLGEPDGGVVTKPLPAALQPVATQLKTLIPNAVIYLADMLSVRAMAGQKVSAGQIPGTSLEANVSIRGDSPAVVRLDNLRVRGDASGTSGSFSTNLDVPLGAHVVVGKATPGIGSGERAVVIVLTASLLD